MRKYRNFGRIRRVIIRAGVGVNFREPPDEIGRVGISDMYVRLSSPSIITWMIQKHATSLINLIQELKIWWLTAIILENRAVHSVWKDMENFWRILEYWLSAFRMVSIREMNLHKVQRSGHQSNLWDTSRINTVVQVILVELHNALWNSDVTSREHLACTSLKLLSHPQIGSHTFALWCNPHVMAMENACIRTMCVKQHRSNTEEIYVCELVWRHHFYSALVIREEEGRD